MSYAGIVEHLYIMPIKRKLSIYIKGIETGFITPDDTVKSENGL
jgi:hypothetical protein